jgi:hypothetical protein
MDSKVNLHPYPSVKKTERKKKKFLEKAEHTRFSAIFAALLWNDDSRGVTRLLAMDANASRTDIMTDWSLKLSAL